MSTLSIPARGRAERPLALAQAARAAARNYVVRRVLKAVLTIFLITTMTFFLVRLLPGNPVDTYISVLIGQYGMSYQDAANQAAGLFSFNPNQPLSEQYIQYLQALSHGDLGTPLLSKGT